MKWGSKTKKEEAPAPKQQTLPQPREKGTSVGLTIGGSLPAKLADMYAQDAQDNLANVQDTFFRMSIQGGKFKIEKKMVGKDGVNFEAIVLRETPINLYYSTRYDPSNPTPPDCWSLGGLKPDPMCQKMQSETCAACKFNKFGSAIGQDGKRKGKACNNTRRLVLKIEGVDLPVILSLPPMSGKLFNQYLKELTSNTPPLPMFAVVTEFGFDSTVAYPRPNMKAIDMLSENEYHQMREYRKSAEVDKALYAYASSEDFSQGSDEDTDEDRTADI